METYHQALNNHQQNQVCRGNSLADYIGQAQTYANTAGNQLLTREQVIAQLQAAQSASLVAPTPARQEAMTPQPEGPITFLRKGGHGTFHEDGLHEKVQAAMVITQTIGVTYDAWVEGTLSGDAETERAKAIAAGRLVDVVDGEYVLRGIAVEEAKPEIKLHFPSGATVHTDGEKIVGRTEPAPALNELLKDWVPFSVRNGFAEKKRAPLTWNTSKPFDAFAGFEVTRGPFNEDDTDDRLRGPLQKMNEGNPRNGSAFLLKD